MQKSKIMSYAGIAEGLITIMALLMAGYSSIFQFNMLTIIFNSLATLLIGTMMVIFMTIAVMTFIGEDKPMTPDTRTPWEKAHAQYLKHH